MHNGWRWLKWTSLLIATGSIVIAVFLIWSAGPQRPARDSNGTEKPRTEVDAPVIVERKDGRVLWQLRASEASQQLDGQMHLIGPQLRLYTETGAEVNINGEQAWFNPLKRNVHFQDHVKVVYGEWTMTSQSLIYSSSSDQLSVPGAFIIHGKTVNAHGKHMVFHRINEQVDVKEGVWIEDTSPKWQGVTPR
ncbi:LPS export ABC transporter periplasmic protein LptC [Mariprofundus ferrooxydans]|uniref:LPS export ABC transporter periplasmic protein LptC n=1 Tax=Mariprofundus ferrooxydans PV-1 TaxID=314345 RepID=Q0EXN7_9PROT|nr:LPS export ABC transporter periplasmic protein LptC [Mariprofundus ferrooxydans]EAU54010.1 hypothetical protein SPV1_03198 [Mariprofundus ferrooxydans PV-1]KON46572.1 hypothetical protein AL013_12325 [Mariprofundus ferrooxydans]